MQSDQTEKYLEQGPISFFFFLVKRAKGNQIFTLEIVSNDITFFKIANCTRNVNKTGFYMYLVSPFIEIVLLLR